jgi:hypothetical protein
MLSQLILDYYLFLYGCIFSVIPLDTTFRTPTYLYPTFHYPVLRYFVSNGAIQHNNKIDLEGVVKMLSVFIWLAFVCNFGVP